jgi:hypothetical protein
MGMHSQKEQKKHKWISIVIINQKDITCKDLATEIERT